MQKTYLTNVGLRLNGKSHKAGSIVQAKPEEVQDLVDRDLLIEQGDAERAGSGKPSDGLNYQQLKEALKERGIAFAGNANKAELAALLDAAPGE